MRRAAIVSFHACDLEVTVLEKDCAELHIVRRRQPIAAVAVLNFAVSKTPASRDGLELPSKFHSKLTCTIERRYVRFRLRMETVECLLRVCAVKRRRFPVGASPTRRPLQPEATGAGMEVTIMSEAFG